MLHQTEHNRPLTIGGALYEPDGSLAGAAFTASAGLAPGQGGLGGALADAAITEADLAAGLWDGARLDVIRADWTAPEFFLPVWSGRLSEVRRGAQGFEAALVSLKADLERPVGRLYTRGCDAVFGDARCGADPAAFPGLGCDQRFETCRDVFANTDNFRGFPHMPGPDFVLLGPAATGNTGGRR
jgi:uncharacterized phage protein (TIGR02218 family)